MLELDLQGFHSVTNLKLINVAPLVSHATFNTYNVKRTYDFCKLTDKMMKPVYEKLAEVTNAATRMRFEKGSKLDREYPVILVISRLVGQLPSIYSLNIVEFIV